MKQGEMRKDDRERVVIFSWKAKELQRGISDPQQEISTCMQRKWALIVEEHRKCMKSMQSHG